MYGINQHEYNPARHTIITAASCATNCLASVVRVMNESIGIKHGCMTTIHDIANTQTIIDKGHSDLRRACSYGELLIPTTIGSAKAITKIFSELEGFLNSLAVRVSLQNASLTGFVFKAKRPTSVDEVNSLFKQASENALENILGFEERSSILDAPSIMVVDGAQVKYWPGR